MDELQFCYGGATLVEEEALCCVWMSGISF